MPTNLPQFNEAKANPAQTLPFVWLFSIVVPSATKSVLRLTSNNEDVTYGTSSDGTPLVYHSTPIQGSTIQQLGDGSLPKFTLTVANIGGDMLRTMDSNDYLRGQAVDIFVVHTAQLADPNANIRFPGTVVNSSINELGATITLSAVDLYATTVPRIPLQPFTCWKGYGSPECGFDITALDPGLTLLGLCPKDLAACRLRGDLEESNNRARLHPRKWGGMPGMEQA